MRTPSQNYEVSLAMWDHSLLIIIIIIIITIYNSVLLHDDFIDDDRVGSLPNILLFFCIF